MTKTNDVTEVDLSPDAVSRYQRNITSYYGKLHKRALMLAHNVIDNLTADSLANIDADELTFQDLFRLEQVNKLLSIVQPTRAKDCDTADKISCAIRKGQEFNNRCEAGVNEENSDEQA